MKIKVLLVGNDDSCNRLQSYLADDDISVVGGMSDENRVIDEISRKTPDIILFTDASSMSIRICQQIYLLRPRSIPVFLADINDMATMQAVMASGVHHVISPDIEPVNLIIEIKSIHSNEANRIVMLENTVTSSNKSKAILVFGAKDGLGKTTLAVSLATALAEFGNKVALLDFDMQFGDVGSLLGINAKGTIVNLLEEQSNPSADVIRQFMSIHISGVNYLPAPKSPEEGKMVTTGQIERIIGAVRVYYDYLIIDVPSGFDDVSATCIDIASRILVVGRNEIPSLRDAKKCLSILLALTNKEKLNLVISKSPDASISSRECSAALDMDVWGEVPYDAIASIKAANQGNPVYLDSPKSKVSRAIYTIADKIDCEDGKKNDNRKSLKAGATLDKSSKSSNSKVKKEKTKGAKLKK